MNKFFSFKVLQPIERCRYMSYYSQLQIISGIHILFFLFLLKNIHYGYSLEVHWLGTSIEYPQHMLLWRNKKKYEYLPVEKGALCGAVCCCKCQIPSHNTTRLAFLSLVVSVHTLFVNDV